MATDRSDGGEPSRGRSTFRVLGMLFLLVAGGLAAIAACVSAYVGSTPERTLEVPRSELAVRVPKFYALPSMGADSSGRTSGVWITLEDDGSATALLARDPHSGATVPWRPELRVEGITGVYRDTRTGSTYDRDGMGLVGPSPRGLDSYDVEVSASRLIVDLARVRLGACRTAEVNECSRPGAPAYRSRPPAPLLAPGT